MTLDERRDLEQMQREYYAMEEKVVQCEADIADLVEALEKIRDLMRKDFLASPFRGYANPRGEVTSIAVDALAKYKGEKP